MVESFPPFVVLDDDPTGAQTLAGVRVLLSWTPTRLRKALEDRPAVHLITNTRALPPEQVRTVVADAVRTSLDAAVDAVVVLRGDSTLRGHLLEEYLGVRDVVAPAAWPVLLLVPALPSAGRVTIGGVHLFERNGERTPLHETEYARDGVFAFRSARLLEWAQERSSGLFPSASGREIPLDMLRKRGAAVVVEALAELATRGVPAVLAPDAETDSDLETIADGWRQAVRRGIVSIVRCAPAFVGALAGTTAPGLLPAPRARGGVLLVCGSYVEQTTRQLARLVSRYPTALVEVDVRRLAGAGSGREVERLAGEVSRRLVSGRLALLATARERPPGMTDLGTGGRIAAGLASIVSRLRPPPEVVVAKGGITAAVTLRDGIGANEADVVGPVEPGVSHWLSHWPGGARLDYVVVPGNVGDDDLLLRLIGAMTGTPAC